MGIVIWLFFMYDNDTKLLKYKMQKSLLTLIQNRISTPAKNLASPAPNKDELEQIMHAVASVPDHGHLVPYRFIVIEGEGRQALSELFVMALKKRSPNASAEKIKKQGAKPLRSPMIMVCVSSVNKSSSILASEQKATANAAVMQMMLASNSLGFATVWLTGEHCYDWTVKEALGLKMNEEIMGFVYLGTATLKITDSVRPSASNLYSYWSKTYKVESKY